MDETTVVESLEAFLERITYDRLVKIYVGAGTDQVKPFIVQQALLEKASEYFKNALKPGTFCEGQEGTLKFPEDDRDTWLVLIFWMFHRKLPALFDDVAWVHSLTSDTKAERILVQCWCLGDKYGISDFQNTVMWWILKFYENWEISFPALKEAFASTPPQSKLRRLAAEEAVARYSTRTLEHEDMDELDGLGFMSEFFRAERDWDQNANRTDVIWSETGGRVEIWKEFMVGEGTKGFAFVWNDKVDEPYES